LHREKTENRNGYERPSVIPDWQSVSHLCASEARALARSSRERLVPGLREIYVIEKL
jgi:hypothetical protein